MLRPTLTAPRGTDGRTLCPESGFGFVSVSESVSESASESESESDSVPVASSRVRPAFLLVFVSSVG
jgi:hypothetical protein